MCLDEPGGLDGGEMFYAEQYRRLPSYENLDLPKNLRNGSRSLSCANVNDLIKPAGLTSSCCIGTRKHINLREITALCRSFAFLIFLLFGYLQVLLVCRMTKTWIVMRY